MKNSLIDTIKPWDILFHSGALLDGTELSREYCWASVRCCPSYPYFECCGMVFDAKTADYICDVEEIKGVLCKNCNQFHPYRNCNEY